MSAGMTWRNAHPGGMREISRWWSEERAQPPERPPPTDLPPRGKRSSRATSGAHLVLRRGTGGYARSSLHHRLISAQPSGLGILIFNLLHKTSLAAERGKHGRSRRTSNILRVLVRSQRWQQESPANHTNSRVPIRVIRVIRWPPLLAYAHLLRAKTHMIFEVFDSAHASPLRSG